MKIAFIGQKGYPATYGGVEKVVDRLVSGLSSRGHSCLVYSRQYYSIKYRSSESIERVVVRGIRSKRLDTITHTFVSILDVCRRDVDVVSLHSFANSIFLLPLKLAGKKVVVHLHGFEWDAGKWGVLDKMFLRLPLLALRIFPTVITTVSKHQQEVLRAHHLESLFVPNGIETPSADDHSFTGPNPYFLFVGRLVPKKGVEFLLRAFLNLNRKDFDLYIVGESDNADGYYDRLRDIASSADNIRFLGGKYGEDLKSLYRGCFAVVIPSEVEANPMVLLEALSYRKCVLASRIPGIQEVGGDMPSYFEPGSSQDLFDKLSALVCDPTLALSKAKQVDVDDLVSRYNWERIIAQYEEIFATLLNVGKPTISETTESV